MQIFADFCGYTNIAIGVALLLGFEFPQNFDSPYAAVSLQDFWRRWHMTLSRWLRDYLYIPLGGNRKGRLLTYRNLLLTMLLGGLWHGAAWTFVVWGGIHGARPRRSSARPAGGRRRAAAQWFGRIAHVPRRLLRVDLLPRRLVRAAHGEVIDAAVHARGAEPSPLVTTSVVLAILVGHRSGSTCGPGAVGAALRGFQRLPVPRAGDGASPSRSIVDQHTRPGGRRALHLLPLLMRTA